MPLIITLMDNTVIDYLQHSLTFSASLIMLRTLMFFYSELNFTASTINQKWKLLILLLQHLISVTQWHETPSPLTTILTYSTTKWLSKIQRPIRHLICHFGGELFQAIACTDTDNQTQKNLILLHFMCSSCIYYSDSVCRIQFYTVLCELRLIIK